jgi:hypothetical protein
MPFLRGSMPNFGKAPPVPKMPYKTIYRRRKLTRKKIQKAYSNPRRLAIAVGRPITSRKLTSFEYMQLASSTNLGVSR